MVLNLHSDFVVISVKIVFFPRKYAKNIVLSIKHKTFYNTDINYINFFSLIYTSNVYLVLIWKLFYVCYDVKHEHIEMKCFYTCGIILSQKPYNSPS